MRAETEMRTYTRVVEAEDLANGGWVCEICDGEFQVGDVAYGRETSRDVYERWVCERCHHTGEPVFNNGMLSRPRHIAGATLILKGPRVKT